jgi:hypothetical protein
MITLARDRDHARLGGEEADVLEAAGRVVDDEPHTQAAQIGLFNLGEVPHA